MAERIIDKLNEITSEFSELTKENKNLKQKIMKNIELLNEAENVIKNLKEQVAFLENQSKSGSTQVPLQVHELKRELEESKKALNTANDQIKERDNEISVLKLRASTSTLSEQSQLNDLKQQILQKNHQISELTSLNNELKMEIEKLETPKTPIETPAPEVDSSSSLNVLCQDLQDKLNKSKKYSEKLESELSNLKGIQDRGSALERITELENRNEKLLEKLKELEADQLALEDPHMIKKLQEQLKEKEKIILELKSKEAKAPTIITSETKAPSGLIEDLQIKINKLKFEIKKKDEMISKLKS